MIWFPVRVFGEKLSICVCVLLFPLEFESGARDLIVLVHIHCLYLAIGHK